MSDLLEDIEFASVSFKARATVLPPELRPVWRIALTLLFLRFCCREEKSSLIKLQILHWAVRSEESRNVFLGILAGDVAADKTFVRFDPAVRNSIDFALGEGLIGRVSADKFQITARGTAMVNEIFECTDQIMEAEVQFMKSIGKKLSDALINRLTRD